MRRFTICALVLVLVGGCGYSPPVIPTLPTTTDKDFQTALSMAFHFLKITGETVEAALDAEMSLKARGAVPESVDVAFKAAARDYALGQIAVVQKIQSGVLKTWQDVTAVVNPLIGKVNAIVQVAKDAGPNVLVKIFEGLASIALAIFCSQSGSCGFMAGGAPAENPTW